jgi:hypothetical protein
MSFFDEVGGRVVVTARVRIEFEKIGGFRLFQPLHVILTSPTATVSLSLSLLGRRLRRRPLR